MEQRIGSKSQPLDAAAVDPAYIPGLTSPVPAEPVADEAATDTEDSDAEDSAVEEAEEVEESGTEEVDSEVEASEDEATEDEASEEAEADADGPTFEASDRRASITADHRGVQLRLDDQQAEFRWDEIGAVETESPRFGKRFTITVHTPDRRWYPIEIEATSRARFKDWEDQLDAVLDAYFEEDVEESAP